MKTTDKRKTIFGLLLCTVIPLQGIANEKGAAESPDLMKPALYRMDTLSAEVLGDKIVRRYVHGTNSTIAEWTLKAGAVVPVHRHSNEQMTLIVEGSAQATSGGRTFRVSTGDLIVFPPDVEHGFTFLEDSIVIDFFAPHRADWVREPEP